MFTNFPISKEYIDEVVQKILPNFVPGEDNIEQLKEITRTNQQMLDSIQRHAADVALDYKIPISKVQMAFSPHLCYPYLKDKYFDRIDKFVVTSNLIASRGPSSRRNSAEFLYSLIFNEKLPHRVKNVIAVGAVLRDYELSLSIAPGKYCLCVDDFFDYFSGSAPRIDIRDSGDSYAESYQEVKTTDASPLKENFYKFYELSQDVLPQDDEVFNDSIFYIKTTYLKVSGSFDVMASSGQLYTKQDIIQSNMDVTFLKKESSQNNKSFNLQVTFHSTFRNGIPDLKNGSDEIKEIFIEHYRVYLREAIVIQSDLFGMVYIGYFSLLLEVFRNFNEIFSSVTSDEAAKKILEIIDQIRINGPGLIWDANELIMAIENSITLREYAFRKNYSFDDFHPVLEVTPILDWKSLLTSKDSVKDPSINMHHSFIHQLSQMNAAKAEVHLQQNRQSSITPAKRRWEGN